MANHYLLVGVASRDWDRIHSAIIPDEEEDRRDFDGELTDSEIVAMVNAIEKKNTVSWMRANVTSIVSIRISEADGDMEPRIVQVVLPWKSPTQKWVDAITEDLCERYFLKSIAWVAHDPSDGSTHQRKPSHYHYAFKRFNEPEEVSQRTSGDTGKQYCIPVGFKARAKAQMPSMLGGDGNCVQPSIPYIVEAHMWHATEGKGMYWLVGMSGWFDATNFEEVSP